MVSIFWIFKVIGCESFLDFASVPALNVLAIFITPVSSYTIKNYLLQDFCLMDYHIDKRHLIL
jgi:uncharacterized membrane protein YwzB